MEYYSVMEYFGFNIIWNHQVVSEGIHCMDFEIAQETPGYGMSSYGILLSYGQGMTPIAKIAIAISISIFIKFEIAIAIAI